MSLLARQMAERRERILEATREIIGERGFEGLTMRDLAQASGVTVPTLYNLIGSKDQVLFAAVEEQTERFLRGIERAPGDALAVVRATVRELLRMPSYYRSLLRLLQGSAAAGPARRDVGRALRGQFRTALGELAEDGRIEPWVDLDALANSIRSLLSITTLEWAHGRVASGDLERAAVYGAALQLLAVARAPARDHFAGIVRESQPRGARGEVRVVPIGSRR